MNRVRPDYTRIDPTRRVRLTGKSPDEVLGRRLGQPYLDYRRRWEAASRFEAAPPFPLHLDVDANYTCNLACIMCPLGASGFPVSYDQKMLDIDLYERVIHEGAREGLAAVRLGVTGEPLLRPDLFDFIRIAKEAGLVDVMLITNGVALTPEVSARLIASGLTRLMVSVDAATESTYQRIRGGRLSKVVDHILKFLEIREQMDEELPLLRVSFVRMRFNQAEEENFKDFWSDRADYLSLQEYTNILGRPDTAFFAGPRPKTPDFRCADPWQRMGLFVNGDLFPCCSDFGRLAPLGNAGRQSVASVWRGPAAERLRRLHQQGQWRKEPVCRRCALASTGGNEQGAA